MVKFIEKLAFFSICYDFLFDAKYFNLGLASTVDSSR